MRKDQIEQLKDLYKSLIRISEITYENEYLMNAAIASLDKASNVLQHAKTNENAMAGTFKELTEFRFAWLTASHEQYHLKDYGFVFEKYINN